VERAVHEFLRELHAGPDEADADRYNGRFAEDVMWGSPYGATIAGIGTLLPIHRRLMAQGAAPRSRFELVQLQAPIPGVVLAQIRRQALSDGGFSEVALYVLVQRNGQWWLAAAQNTPVATPPDRTKREEAS
jgi:hypothetical protein